MTSPRQERRAGRRSETLEHLEALFGLGMRLTGGDAARTEALVRDTMLEVVRGRGDGITGLDLRHRLMDDLRDRFLAARRERGRRLADTAGEGVPDRPERAEPEEAERERDVLERLPPGRLAAAIDRLDEELRIPLVLGDVEGLTYEGIGAALGLPSEVARNRLFRARRRLRERLLGREGSRASPPREDRRRDLRPTAAARARESDAGPGGITCRQALEVSYEYLDGELDPETQERIHRHVEICQRCYPAFDRERLFLDTLRERGLAVGNVDHLRDRLERLLEEVD